jgi:orotate phosphoribosyltransferase
VYPSLAASTQASSPATRTPGWPSGIIGCMAETDLTQIAADLDSRCRLHGSFTLRSGVVTDEYFDKYLFEADPVLLRRVAGLMQPLIPAGADMLGGLELGGVPLATMLSQITGLPALFVRKQAKAYGTAKLAEGDSPAGQHVVLVEDVITSGGTVLSAARSLRDLGATVSAVVCVIDRSAPGADTLATEGVHVISLLTKADLDSATDTPGPGVSLQLDPPG